FVGKVNHRNLSNYFAISKTKFMYLAYSAINSGLTTHQHTNEQQEPNVNDWILRYNAYQVVCGKYADEIIAIQKYFPGWMPRFC
ncbi:MAG: hypothetical protein M3N14_10310, partial [Bacteroidota bacterium]|nr:hypothetical protein [Bacteroidota bacterium]